MFFNFKIFFLDNLAFFSCLNLNGHYYENETANYTGFRILIFTSMCKVVCTVFLKLINKNKKHSFTYNFSLHARLLLLQSKTPIEYFYLCITFFRCTLALEQMHTLQIEKKNNNAVLNQEGVQHELYYNMQLGVPFNIKYTLDDNYIYYKQR